MRKRTNWPRKAFNPENKGKLSHQLGISEVKNIPVSLLSRIKKAEIGDTIRNPTKLGKRRIKVTALLKKRAVLAHTSKTRFRR